MGYYHFSTFPASSLSCKLIFSITDKKSNKSSNANVRSIFSVRRLLIQEEKISVQFSLLRRLSKFYFTVTSWIYDFSKKYKKCCFIEIFGMLHIENGGGIERCIFQGQIGHEHLNRFNLSKILKKAKKGNFISIFSKTQANTFRNLKILINFSKFCKITSSYLTRNIFKICSA